MKKKYIAVLLCALLFCGLIGCASTEPTQNSTDGSASLLQEATNWFESQTSKYEILSAEAVNDSAIFLTGTKNPDTDEYQLLQVFIVDRTDIHSSQILLKGGNVAVLDGVPKILPGLLSKTLHLNDLRPVLIQSEDFHIGVKPTLSNELFQDRLR